MYLSSSFQLGLVNCGNFLFDDLMIWSPYCRSSVASSASYYVTGLGIAENVLCY